MVRFFSKNLLLFTFAIALDVFANDSVFLSDTTKGDIHFNIAEDFYRSSKHDSSSVHYLKASQFYFEEKNWHKYLQTLNYAALDFGYLSKPEIAINLLKEGVIFGIERFGEIDSINAILFNSLGTIYYNNGNYNDALASYDLSLRIRHILFGDNHNETAGSYHNIALVWNFLGDHDKALEYLNKALATWYPLYGNTNSSMGNCYINIANAYAAMGEYEKSIEFDIKALDTWINILGEKHRYIAMSYNNLAESYENIGEFKKAIEYADKSLQLNTTIFGQNHPQVAKNRTLLSKIHKGMNNLNESKKYINEALDIWRNHPNNIDVNSTFFQSADLNIKFKNYYQALAEYDSILLRILPEVLDSNYTPGNNLNLPTIKVSYLYAVAGKGNVYLERCKNTGMNIPDLKNAYYWFELYSKILNKIQQSYRRENSKLNLSKSVHKNNSKILESLYELYLLTKDNKYKTLAYTISSSTKSSVLSDAIVESGAKKFSGIPEDLIDQEITFQKKLEEAFNKLSNIQEDSLGIKHSAEIRKEIFDINHNYDNLIKTLETDYPLYFKLKYESSRVTAGEIQTNLLDSTSALVEYFIDNKSTYIFVITNEKIVFKRMPLPALFDQVKLFRNSLQNLEFENYLTSSFELYGSLILPIGDELLNKNKIYIIADGILNYLPFEALTTKKVISESMVDFSKIPYLINDYEIVYSYSNELLLANRLKEPIKEYSFVGIAPIFSDDKLFKNNIENLIDSTITNRKSSRSIRIKDKTYSSLPYSESEVLEISELFKINKHPSLALLRSEATEEKIKSELIQNYNILHIASHGFINEKRPKRSGILFWGNDSLSNEDAILHLGEIFNIKLNSDLVVLSACESGLGKLVSGEGIIGLTRGFIYAGTKNVIISLWQVADQSTSQLMIEFYKYLLNGNNYSKALRLAKLKLINEGKYAYPLEWSPFIHIGN